MGNAFKLAAVRGDPFLVKLRGHARVRDTCQTRKYDNVYPAYELVFERYALWKMRPRHVNLP